MQLIVDSDGMGIRVDLDTENNADARALYSATKRGDISGMSFAFKVEGEEWTDLDADMPTRHITAISKVNEVSAVTFPAYEATFIEARDVEALDNAKAALDNAKQAQKDAEIRNKILELLGEKSDEQDRRDEH